jgi:hypothetical protein
MSADTGLRIFFKPGHLSRWLKQPELEKRLTLLDLFGADLSENRLTLALRAIVQAKPHGGGRIGVRSGDFAVYVKSGRVESATDFERSNVTSTVSEGSSRKREITLSPEIKGSTEGGAEISGNVGNINVGGERTNKASIKFAFEEGAIEKVGGETFVKWSIYSARGIHPYHEFLSIELPLNTVLAFHGSDKRGSLDVRLTSPEYFNSQGVAQPKFTVLLACIFNKVKWRDSMEFWIGSVEKR